MAKTHCICAWDDEYKKPNLNQTVFLITEEEYKQILQFLEFSRRETSCTRQ